MEGVQRREARFRRRCLTRQSPALAGADPAGADSRLLEHLASAAIPGANSGVTPSTGVGPELVVSGLYTTRADAVSRWAYRLTDSVSPKHGAPQSPRPASRASRSAAVICG